MSLTKKLLLFLLLVFLLPVVFISYFLMRGEFEELRKMTINKEVVIAELCAGQASNYFNEQKIIVKDWSLDKVIRENTEAIIKNNSQENKTALNKYLQEKVDFINDDNFLAVTVHDSQGKIIASSNAGLLGKYEEISKIKDILNLSLGQAELGYFEYGEEHHLLDINMIHAVSPIYSLQGGVVAAMVNHINYNALQEICLKGAELSNQPDDAQEQYLIDKEGYLLTAPLLDEEDLILKQKVSLPGLQECFQNNGTINGEWVNYKGERVLGSVTCFANYALVAETDKSIIMDEINSRILNIVIISSFLLIFIIGVVLLLVRIKIRQIKNNLKTLDQIGRGNFKARVPISGNDEISQVGRKINQVAVQLKRIYEEETRLASVVRNLHDAVLLTDKKHIIKYVNPAWEALNGWKKEEVINKKTPGILKSGKQSKSFYKKMMNEVHKGKQFRADMINKKKDGGLYTAEMIIFSIKNKKGEIIYYAQISHDISERKKAEEKNKELDSLKSKFITVVSHQLRTPLNEIKWILETILAGTIGKVSKEQKNLIKSGYDSSAKIIDRINDLITVMDIEEHDVKLEKTDVYLDSLIDSLLIEYDKDIKFKKLKVFLDKSKKRIKLQADSVQMKHAVSKLLDNAIKYTEEGGEIKIILEKKNNELYFTIKDNGIGIPVDDQENIFTKFFRASNAFTVVTDASGLGLFIAKSIIEAHGGEIWFNSREGKGSEFYFKLNIKK